MKKIILFLMFCIVVSFGNAQEFERFRYSDPYPRGLSATLELKGIDRSIFKGTATPDDFYLKYGSKFRDKNIEIFSACFKDSEYRDKECVDYIRLSLMFDKNYKLVNLMYFIRKKHIEDIVNIEDILYKVYQEYKKIDFSEYFEIRNKNISYFGYYVIPLKAKPDAKWD